MSLFPGTIGAGAGDEIICDPVVQFHGIACLHNNIVPVWADIRADNFLMDVYKIEALMTPRTRAIWVTHLWGFPAEVDKLRDIADRHGIYLLEDCAHCTLGEYKGKKLGTWGHIGTFSFNMGKQLATGECGMLIMDDPELYRRASEYHDHGHLHDPSLSRGMEKRNFIGLNYRMMELQGALGLAQLAKLEGVILAGQRKNKARMPHSSR